MSDRSYRQEYECEFLEAATAVFPDDVVERLVDNDERHITVPSDLTLGSMVVSGEGPWGDL
jgi:hypothetical protein